jgi:hypothetical protein
MLQLVLDFGLDFAAAVTGRGPRSGERRYARRPAPVWQLTHGGTGTVSPGPEKIERCDNRAEYSDAAIHESDRRPGDDVAAHGTKTPPKLAPEFSKTDAFLLTCSVALGESRSHLVSLLRSRPKFRSPLGKY